MRSAVLAAAVVAGLGASDAVADWQIQPVPTVGPVKALDTADGEPVVSIGHGWFRLIADGTRVRMVATAGPLQRPMPPNALPDGRIAEGRQDIARAWLAEPTDRYAHGVLGDAIEAASLVIERRDRSRETVRLGQDSVFEDIEPRIADLNGGGEKVIVVKSYLKQGSALAVIGERGGHYTILDETPPAGGANRWLSPAGIADFDGDGAVDIALVRMPHALGVLELWQWHNERLHKILDMPDVSNHVVGSRAVRMSAVADFDGDGLPDLAIPSFDRKSLRIIAFAPQPRDIARVALPARAATDFALTKDQAGRPAAVLGLDNGALIVVRRSANGR